MSCERALNFDQWKTTSENYEPIRATFLRVYSNSKEVSYLSWQNTYPNLKTAFHINLKFLLWTKLLENLFLAKYLYLSLHL